MKTELYRNPILFNRMLAKRFEDFDCDASNNLSRWSFADKQGKVFESQVAVHMFEKLNSRFGEFIDLKRSITRRRMYVITCLEEEITAEPVLTLDKPDAIEFNLEYANSLYSEEDELGSRKKLEEYGRTLGVELKRNKKFENMLKTLVETFE